VELQHTFTVPIGLDDAWAAFNDIEGIAPCLPGATITSVDGDEFTGAAKVKLGPISLQYTGKGRWASRDAAEYRAVIEASGKDRRGNGTAAATITGHLEPEGSGTRVVLDTDLKITGRPAQFGRGVIEEVGNKLLDQFAACLSQRLGQDEAAGSGEGGSGEPALPAVAGETPPAVPEGADAGQRVLEDPTPPDVRADELARAAAVGAAAASASSAASVPASVAASSAEAAQEDPSLPDVPVGDAAGEAGGPSLVLEPADVPDVPTSPVGAAPVATSAPAPAAAPAPAPTRRPAAPTQQAAELDLGGLVGPVLLRQYGPTVAAVVVTAIVTWFLARRRS
jgi:carbon monoxide dehydrogenase subunit G